MSFGTENFVNKLMEMDRLKRQWDELEQELLTSTTINWSRIPGKPPEDDEKGRLEYELSKPEFFHAVYKGWVICITEFDTEWQGLPPGSKGADGLMSSGGTSFRIPPPTAFKLVAQARQSIARRSGSTRE